MDVEQKEGEDIEEIPRAAGKPAPAVNQQRQAVGEGKQKRGKRGKRVKRGKTSRQHLLPEM